MADLAYTPAYWKRALKLVDAMPHVCEYCRRPHDERKGQTYCYVRVIDIGKQPGESANLALACRRCRSGPRGVKLSKKQILDRIAELPFPEPVKAEAARG